MENELVETEDRSVTAEEDRSLENVGAKSDDAPSVARSEYS